MDDGMARNGWTTAGAVGGTRVTPAIARAATAGSRDGSGLRRIQMCGAPVGGGNRRALVPEVPGGSVAYHP